MKPKNFPGRVAVRRARAHGDRNVAQEDMRMRVGVACRDESGAIVATPPGFPKTFVEHGLLVKRTTLMSKTCGRCFSRFLSARAREKHEEGCDR